jgi:hypothetical protein
VYPSKDAQGEPLSWQRVNELAVRLLTSGRLTLAQYDEILTECGLDADERQVLCIKADVDRIRSAGTAQEREAIHVRLDPEIQGVSGTRVIETYQRTVDLGAAALPHESTIRAAIAILSNIEDVRLGGTAAARKAARDSRHRWRSLVAPLRRGRNRTTVSAHQRSEVARVWSKARDRITAFRQMGEDVPAAVSLLRRLMKEFGKQQQRPTLEKVLAVAKNMTCARPARCADEVAALCLGLTPHRVKQIRAKS